MAELSARRMAGRGIEASGIEVEASGPRNWAQLPPAKVPGPRPTAHAQGRCIARSRGGGPCLLVEHRTKEKGARRAPLVPLACGPVLHRVDGNDNFATGDHAADSLNGDGVEVVILGPGLDVIKAAKGLVEAPVHLLK